MGGDVVQPGGQQQRRQGGAGEELGQHGGAPAPLPASSALSSLTELHPKHQSNIRNISHFIEYKLKRIKVESLNPNI